MENFNNRLKWLIDEVSGGNVTEFAKKTNIRQATLHNYTKGRMPNAESLNNICSYLNVNLNWLLTGKGEPFIKFADSIEQSAPATPKSENVIEIRHMELVKGFKDKSRALNINSHLMELERLDADAFKRIESYIKGTVDTIRELAEKQSRYGPDRRKAERRIQHRPGKIPNGMERRSGQDRRKNYKAAGSDG